MSFTPMVASAAESASEINPYLVGGLILALLLAAMLVLLMIGKGRDHS